MALKRGDIIEVYFDFPRVRNSKPHPAVILSNEDVYDTEEGYICAIMSSSKNYIDKFTFEVNDKMLQKTNNKEYSQVRCHLVTFVYEVHLNEKNYAKNSFKPNSLERLISRINEVSLTDVY